MAGPSKDERAAVDYAVAGVEHEIATRPARTARTAGKPAGARKTDTQMLNYADTQMVICVSSYLGIMIPGA
jgi:hypothetical protein